MPELPQHDMAPNETLPRRLDSLPKNVRLLVNEKFYVTPDKTDLETLLGAEKGDTIVLSNSTKPGKTMVSYYQNTSPNVEFWYSNVDAGIEVKVSEVNSEPAQERNKEPKIEVGKIYRLAKNAPTGALKYELLYNDGEFINCRVLSGPDEHGLYEVETTQDGKPIGERGWNEHQFYSARDLENLD